MKRRPALAMAVSVALLTAGVSAVAAGSASAAGTGTASFDWEMNEGPGATVMRDSALANIWANWAGTYVRLRA